ncbi:hypothetical protein HYDPIDRAFT_110599 [Hydnomerulius pinastri MD-312]|nr:hypothetical protein HYDPIDRAFT_110599 [Hydnomerulius pinastri MD-312]
MKCCLLFMESRFRAQRRIFQPFTRVTHKAFISVLDDWLDNFSACEATFSHCPFN